MISTTPKVPQMKLQSSTLPLATPQEPEINSQVPKKNSMATSSYEKEPQTAPKLEKKQKSWYETLFGDDDDQGEGEGMPIYIGILLFCSKYKKK